jgi:hypothetical protein
MRPFVFATLLAAAIFLTTTTFGMSANALQKWRDVAC